MKKIVVAVLCVLLVMLAVRLSAYTVDAAEYAYLTLLGAHVDTLDGADGDRGAGLHFGWPWPIQSVQRLDRRLQQFDLPATEFLTHDVKGKTIDKMLLVEAYVCWRIADRDAVDLFVRRIGTTERANAILEPRIRSELGAAIGDLEMDDLVNKNRARVEQKIAWLHQRLIESQKKQVREEYGIELVDIRMRRFSHPAQVRDSIFELIKSERRTKVTDFDEEGQRKARDIETKGDELAREMLAKARFDEVTIKGNADAEAMRIRNEAHQKDPEFYAFLKKMEKLQSILGESKDSKTVLLLSTNRPMFESLFQPPRPQVDPKKGEKQKEGPP